jgi:hypothetical protein
MRAAKYQHTSPYQPMAERECCALNVYCTLSTAYHLLCQSDAKAGKYWHCGYFASHFITPCEQIDTIMPQSKCQTYSNPEDLLLSCTSRSNMRALRRPLETKHHTLVERGGSHRLLGAEAEMTPNFVL